MATPSAPAGDSVLGRAGLNRLEGATLSLLLTLAGIELVGYRFGDSNQGITVPILKHLMDPSLYRWDAMVATGDRFPTVFYRVLAVLLPGTQSIPAAFFALYVVSVAAALAGVYRIGRWCGGPEAGLVAMLIAVPTRVGIANEALYRVQFSHSHLASALVIWAMVWFLEGRRLLPLLVLSIGAYNHVLYSIYVLVPCLLAVLVERKDVGLRRTVQRLAAGTVPLVPFFVWAFLHRVPMTSEWLELLRLRSSHHSFPSFFGESLPAAAFLLALGTLSLTRLPRDKRALFGIFLAGFAIQFVAGTVFTEFVPVKAVLQYQPHRCWRFLMLLLYGLAAEGVVTGWRTGGFSRVAALVTGVILANPQLEPLLAVALFAQAVTGRDVGPDWARVLAVATLVFLGTWPGPGLELSAADYPVAALTSPTVLGAAALALVVGTARGTGPVVRWVLVAAAAAATVFWLAPRAYDRRRVKWEAGAWRNVQDWVRLHTPKDAIFITPPQETGFRVFSERSTVGEWKDGTQQYFDDTFASEWGARMEAIGSLEKVKTDGELLAIARRFNATYFVLPLKRRHPAFAELYRNGHYVVYAVPLAPGDRAR